MIVRHPATRRLVITTLVFAVVLMLAAITSPGEEVVDWAWLQAHAHQYYVAKGLLSGVGVVLIIAHMIQVWNDEMMLLGQRLRYLSLFFFASLIAATSADQAQVADQVTTRNLGGGVGSILVVIAMIVSIREARRS